MMTVGLFGKDAPTAVSTFKEACPGTLVLPCPSDVDVSDAVMDDGALEAIEEGNAQGLPWLGERAGELCLQSGLGRSARQADQGRRNSKLRLILAARTVPLLKPALRDARLDQCVARG